MKLFIGLPAEAAAPHLHFSSSRFLSLIAQVLIGSPQRSMNPFAALWSNTSSVSYVASPRSYSELGDLRPATTARPLKSLTLTMPRDPLLQRRVEDSMAFVERAEPQPLVCHLGYPLLERPLPASASRVRVSCSMSFVSRDQYDRGGSLVDLPRLDPYKPVLDDVDAADAVLAAELGSAYR